MASFSIPVTLKHHDCEEEQDTITVVDDFGKTRLDLRYSIIKSIIIDRKELPELIAILQVHAKKGRE